MDKLARLQLDARIAVGCGLAGLMAVVYVWPSWLFTVAGLVVWFATVHWLAWIIRDSAEADQLDNDLAVEERQN